VGYGKAGPSESDWIHFVTPRHRKETALGIGANTAIFGIINAAPLRSLPFTEAERLVMIWQTRQDISRSGQRSPILRTLRSRRKTWTVRLAYKEELGRPPNIKRQVGNKIVGNQPLKKLLRYIDQHGSTIIDGDKLALAKAERDPEFFDIIS
jgi:hypothetical protein